MAWLSGYGHKREFALKAAGSIAGTVAVTNNSKNVVGTSTAFREWIVGDYIQLPDDNWYAIESITDDTHLTITVVYPGSTTSGITYDCRHISYQMELTVHKGSPSGFDSSKLADSQGSPEGETYANGKLYQAEEKDPTRIHEVNPSTGAATGEYFDFQSADSVHMSGLTWYDGYLWGVDYTRQKLYKINLATSLSTHSASIAGTFSVGGGAGFAGSPSAIEFVSYDGGTQLLITEWADGGDIIIIDYAQALTDGTAAGNVLRTFKQTARPSNYCYVQGITTYGDYIYVTHDVYPGIDHISKHSLGDLHDIAADTEIFGSTYSVWCWEHISDTAIEDIANDGSGNFFYTDETDNNLYKATESGDSGNNIYLNGYCQDDFDDIAFTQSDGETELWHWLQTGSLDSGVSAVFHVKFNTIPASGSGTFYLYYDKAGGASAHRDADNTFVFFDHFASWNTDKWGEKPAYCAVTNSEMTMTGASDRKLFSVDDWGLNHAFHFRAKRSSGGTDASWGVAESADWLQGMNRFTEQGDNHVSLQVFTGGSQTQYDTGIVQDTSYHVWRVYRKSSSSTLFYRDVYSHEITTNIDSDNHNILFRTYGVHNVICDWVFVRKCAVHEPTWGTWGSEESAVRIPRHGFTNFQIPGIV